MINKVYLEGYGVVLKQNCIKLHSLCLKIILKLLSNIWISNYLLLSPVLLEISLFAVGHIREKCIL